MYKRGNPCSCPLEETYLTCVTNTQKLVGVLVEQAAPLFDQVAATPAATSAIRPVDVRTHRDKPRRCVVFLGVRFHETG